MNEDSAGLLRWTGHPLVDAGIAGLTAFAAKREPEAVTCGDLEKFVDFAERYYLKGDFSKTVDVLFTRNSFLNPSFKEKQKRERIREAVTAFRQEGTGTLPDCAYCGRPGLRVLHRDDVPMLSGRGCANFYPRGEPGLAICGPCQTALHGLTLGAPRCSGKALVVHADNPRLVLRLAGKWVSDAVRFIQLAEAGSEVPKISKPRTRLVEALIGVQREASDEETAGGVVAYHVSNSGQGPGIQIYQLPSSTIRFLKRVRSQRTAASWGEIERRAWQAVKGGSSAAELSADGRLQYQNFLFEDLFRLPENARRFIRIYFLRSAGGPARSGDVRSGYSSTGEADIVSWDVTKLFLQEVLSMEGARIEAIRSLGDRLAEEVANENNGRLFKDLYYVRNPGRMRFLLLQTSLKFLRRGTPPVLTLSDYLKVFEEGEELVRVDWRLAWDLVLIRLIEQLHAKGWLGQHGEVLEEAAEQAEALSAEEVSV